MARLFRCKDRQKKETSNKKREERTSISAIGKNEKIRIRHATPSKRHSIVFSFLVPASVYRTNYTRMRGPPKKISYFVVELK